MVPGIQEKTMKDGFSLFKILSKKSLSNFDCVNYFMKPIPKIYAHDVFKYQS